MGDGQHSWAAAEWILMIRNCFVREEGDGLVLGAGIAPQWLDSKETLYFGPAPTPFGPIEVSVESMSVESGEKVCVTWQGQWHAEPPPIEVRLPGFVARSVSAGEQFMEMERKRTL